jgi:hypothetical protein
MGGSSHKNVNVPREGCKLELRPSRIVDGRLENISRLVRVAPDRLSLTGELREFLEVLFAFTSIL